MSGTFLTKSDKFKGGVSDSGLVSLPGCQIPAFWDGQQQQ